MRALQLLQGTPSALSWRRSVCQQQLAAPRPHRHCNARWTSRRVQEAFADSTPGGSSSSSNSSSSEINEASSSIEASSVVGNDDPASSSTASPEPAVKDVELTPSSKRLLAVGIPLEEVLERQNKKQAKKAARAGRLPPPRSRKARKAAADQPVQDDAAGAGAGTVPAVPAAPAEPSGAAAGEVELSPSAKRLLAAGYTMEEVLARQYKQQKRGIVYHQKAPRKVGRPRKEMDPGSLSEILQARSDYRLSKYVGSGAPQPGVMTQFALDTAAAAVEGPAPVYAWPQEVPTVLPPQLHIGFATEGERNQILRDIERGADDMANTHTSLQKLLDCIAADSSAWRSSSDATSGSSATNLTSEAASGSSAAIPLSSSAADTSSSSSNSSSSQSAASGNSSSGSSDGSSDSSDCRSETVTAAAAAGHQVYDLHWLQERAAADPSAAAVVPDNHRPFTLTMQNPADGRDYVVAHYEPRVLNFDRAKNAALLAQVYYNGNKMSRNSAPREEKMVMAGMRVPRRAEGSTHFGRYSGDTGPEPDQFSMSCSPDLLRTGGFRVIAGKWMEQLPGMVCEMNQEAAAAVRGRNHRHKRGPSTNFPACTLLGGPFTSLAVTQNYRSNLHAEPKEHPFSYIAWLDVLGPGSTMEVGYFWLTNGLAFTPLDGSVLYIDVRLVPHCSDPSYVRNDNPRARIEYEGRFGAALFIKPDVMAENIEQWAAFDQFLEKEAGGAAPDAQGPSNDDPEGSSSDEDEGAEHLEYSTLTQDLV